MQKLKVKIIDFFGTIFMRLLMDLKDIVDLIVTAGLTVLACFVLVNFFFMPVKVIGTSMYPTLHNSNYGFASIVSRRVEKIERFDIVVIERDGERLVKRVVGLPGESLWYVNDTLYVNGNPIEEEFFNKEYVQQTLASMSRDLFTSDVAMITLGENEYFCLGDNRPVSSDSRYYGPFLESEIVAKGILIIYPFKNFGTKK